jgi:hypothetical protein
MKSQETLKCLLTCSQYSANGPVLSLPIRPLPEVSVKWLVRLLLIREVSGSNLGPDTGYTD